MSSSVGSSSSIMSSSSSSVSCVSSSSLITSSKSMMRQLVLRCAEHISESDFTSAHRLLSFLKSYTSQPNFATSGDSTERLASQFVRALSLRFTRQYAAVASSSSSSSSPSSSFLIRRPEYAPPSLVHHHQFMFLNNIPTTTSSSTSGNVNPVMNLDKDKTSWKVEQQQEEEDDEESMTSQAAAYISLNQITPFIRFCHLTANQAILEALNIHHVHDDHDHVHDDHVNVVVDDDDDDDDDFSRHGHYSSIHIIDFNIMHGLQWPPFMHALVSTRRCCRTPPPSLRITAIGQDMCSLQRTGERLSTFAESIGLTFHFNPYPLSNVHHHDHSRSYYSYSSSSWYSSLFSQINENKKNEKEEALAVNCMMYLHTLLTDNGCGEVEVFLKGVKEELKPKVVTVAEVEARHNQRMLVRRVGEALEHYGTIYESLEGTVAPNSRERRLVEKLWLGKEIEDIVAGEGEGRKERHERYEWWEGMMTSIGFNNISFSPFALSQAKLLLTLHYPSQGYHLLPIHPNHSSTSTFTSTNTTTHPLFLAWNCRPLFSVSSWH